jgi:amidase
VKAQLRRRDLLVGTAAAALAAASPRPALAADSGPAAAGSDIAYRSAADLVAALATKRVSSVELTDFVIARIEARDLAINAVVVRDFARARDMAKAADAARARGETRPLLGLPMTVKEAFNVAGLPTTWGNPRFKGWQPDFDALAVARLKAAGAVILGKTNVPFMLEDWQSYNDIYGTTNNPWDPARTPGGSSGGAAAALAAGFVALELGSDIGGSLRCPARFCGVFAHKPSIDLVPLGGAGPPHVPNVPIRNSLAVAGPMARSAADLALELDVIAGPDERDNGVAYKLALPPARHRDLKSFRVLVVDRHPLCPTAASVQSALDGLADRLGRAGVNVARASLLLPGSWRTHASARRTAGGSARLGPFRRSVSAPRRRGAGTIL